MKTRRSVERARPTTGAQIDLGVDRRAAEALALELSMLAKAHGLNVKQVEVFVLEGKGKAPKKDKSRVGRNDPPGMR